MLKVAARLLMAWVAVSWTIVAFQSWHVDHRITFGLLFAASFAAEFALAGRVSGLWRDQDATR